MVYRKYVHISYTSCVCHVTSCCLTSSFQNNLLIFISELCKSGIKVLTSIRVKSAEQLLLQICQCLVEWEPI